MTLDTFLNTKHIHVMLERDYTPSERDQWADHDIRFLLNGGFEKAAKILEEKKVPFKFHVLMGRELLRSLPDPMVAIGPEYLDSSLAPIVFRNNISRDCGPLTAWMLLHRTAHSQCDPYHVFHDEAFFRGHAEFAPQTIDPSTHMFWAPTEVNQKVRTAILELFFTAISTMRSARKTDVTIHGGDLVAEWFAQYFMGGIKFKVDEESMSRFFALCDSQLRDRKLPEYHRSELMEKIDDVRAVVETFQYRLTQYIEEGIRVRTAPGCVSLL